MRVDELRALQREVLAALARPLTGASRARAALPAGAADDPGFAALARARVAPSATVDAVGRLEIYHRRRWVRLLDALADDYPALRWLLGPAGFAALGERFLAAHPPTTASLADVGVALPAFVASDLAGAPHAVHAVELARLEAAWLRAFAAGDGAPVAAAALAQAPLALAPHLTVLACRTAPDRLWRRGREGQARGRLGGVAAAPRVHLAVFRDRLVRDVVRVHPAAAAILTGLAGGAGLPDALARAAPALPSRGGAARVRAWFGAWTARGWLVHRPST